jgi:hypothetical protein
LAFLLSSAPAPARADDKPTEQGRYEIELLTIYPGESPPAMFGHAAIRVIDNETGADFVYNWGTLDWAPDVPVRFVSGQMVYYLSVDSFAGTMAMYRAEDRTVVGQGLDLSRSEAESLVAAIRRNILPENRDYLYHYINDNCSTRVRDILDVHSGGALRRSARGPSGRTFREIGYYVGAPSAPVVYACDLLGNWTWDRQATRWQAMAIPMNLHAEAARARLADRPLVFAERRYYERRRPGPFSVRLRPGWYVIGIPALLALLSLAALRSRRVSRPLAATGLVSLGLVLGISGSVVLAAWLFSRHEDVKENAALLFLWPTDLALVVLGPLALGRKRPGLARVTTTYSLGRAAVAAVGIVLLLTSVLAQDVFSLAIPALVGLAAAGAALFLARAAREPTRTDPQRPRSFRTRPRSGRR